VQNPPISNGILAFLKRDSNRDLLLFYSAMGRQEEHDKQGWSMRIGAKNNFCQTAGDGSRFENRATMVNCEPCVPDAARPSASGKESVNDWHERRVAHQELKIDPEWQISEKGCREALPRSGFRKT
jgi:hypothetical protein